MKRTKKLFVRAALSIFLILPVLAFGRLLILPQPSHRLIMGFSSFRKMEKIHNSPNTVMPNRNEIFALLNKTRGREELFWGTNHAQILPLLFTAKYEVHTGYSKEKLELIINIINSGDRFEETWSQKGDLRNQSPFIKP